MASPVRPLLQRPLSPRARADVELTAQIAAVHRDARGTYGAPRIHAELVAQGIVIGRAPVHGGRPGSALGRRHHVRADAGRLPVPRGRARRLEAARDRLGHGHSPAHRARAGRAGHGHRAAPAEVIHHSDQGCQYTSLAFGSRCRQTGVRPSMGSVGDAYDNALCENFFATPDRQRFLTRADARLAVVDLTERPVQPAAPPFRAQLPVAHDVRARPWERRAHSARRIDDLGAGCHLSIPLARDAVISRAVHRPPNRGNSSLGHTNGFGAALGRAM